MDKLTIFFDLDDTLYDRRIPYERAFYQFFGGAYTEKLPQAFNAVIHRGYEVVEGKIAIADIMAAAREGKLEEVFGTGTAAVVSPVKELVWKGEHAFIGDGKIGPVTQKLYDTMTGMQWGKLPDTKGWIVPVEKKY